MLTSTTFSAPCLKQGRVRALMQGKRCGQCGNMTVIRKDGCDSWSACGWVGACGQPAA